MSLQHSDPSPQDAALSLMVRVVAPTGRDGELISTVLRQQGIPVETVSSAALMASLEKKDLLGPLLIAEEALNAIFVERLGAALHAQPGWSDLPILILTGNGRETLRSHRLQAERLPLGSPVLLERPIRTATLVSSIQAALRARTRQYEIRDALEALKEEREILQVVLDNLPVGVVLARATGEIVLANKQLEVILRHPPPPCLDLAAHGQWGAFHPDGSRLKAEEFPLTRAIRSGKPLPPEDYVYQRGDGTKTWVSFSASPVLNDRRDVTGGVVAISDIDQQKRSELALIQSEKLAAVGRLAASISHEINNPLEAITNLLYLARNSSGVPDEVREFLETADQELSRVSQIVSHTLRFHRQATRPRAITAEELLLPTLGLYAGRLANAGITLTVDHRSARPVTCYEGEIRQVLNNLVGNAVDSMRTGGRLRISTGDGRCWKDDLRGVRITIADTGHGMTPEVMHRVFEAFYTTKGINGTGLGLWISKGIIEKHHGRLQVHSRVGTESSGTVFSLFLPYEPFAHAPVPEAGLEGSVSKPHGEGVEREVAEKVAAHP